MDSQHVIKNNINKYLSMESRGLGYLLFQKLSEHGQGLMQIDTGTDEQDTFNSFKTKCIRTALHMKKLGLVPQDKITICSYNTLNSTVPLIASFLTGVISSALDPSFSQEDFKYYLSIIKPKVIFTSPEVASRILRATKEINLKSEFVIYGKLTPYHSLDDFLKPIEGEENFEPFSCLSIKDTAMISFSSGTSGKPKAICLNHLYLYRAATLSDMVPKNYRIIYYTSLYWISQISLSLGNIVTGFTKIISASYKCPKDCYETLLKFQVNSFFLAPFHLLELCHYCVNNNLTLPTLQVFASGTFISKNLTNIASKTFPKAKFFNTYAQTEVGLITCYPSPEDHTSEMQKKIFQASSGKIVEGLAIRLVNLETEKPVGINQEGEVRLISPSLMNGYLNTSFKDMFDSEGWFKTGDIAYLDEDEYIYIVGRCKEMLKYRSFPVFPAILEEILLKHPAVQEAVVVGIPHEIDGDHPVAFVKLKEGMEVETEEIREFVDGQVDDRKKLRGGVIVVENFPLTITGKVKRSALKEMFPKVRSQ